MRNSRGMTLIELVIVLALLAGLAGMALTSVGEINSRTRYDETVRRLDRIQIVTTGRSEALGRFVADMGRLPVEQTGDGKQLLELWEQVSGASYDYAPISATPTWPGTDGTDFPGKLPNEISLPGGWHGPYLETGDSGEFYDGFGNAWVLSASSNALSVTSYGSDGKAGGETWDEQDLSRTLTLPDVSLQVTVMGLDRSVSPAVWQPVCAWDLSPRTANVTTLIGDRVYQKIGNANHIFEAVTTGTTGTNDLSVSAITAIGQETSDGGVTWCYRGPSSLFGQYADRVRIALFLPVIGSTSGSVKTILEERDDDAVNANISVEDTGVAALTPGMRKIYAYAYISGDGNALRRINDGAEPMNIELKQGSNYVVLYLR